jgi:hypothetical protein
MNGWKTLLLLAGLMLGGGAAQAAVSCSFGASPGFTIPDYLEGVADSMATSVVVNCTRGANQDPSTVNYTVTFNTGSYNNRARATVSGTNYHIAYTKAATTSCTPAITTRTGSFTWPTTGPPANRLGTKTATVNWAGCIAVQSGMAVGTYTDSIGLTLSNSANGTTAAGTAPVSITLAALCTFTTPPGTLTFNYTAFRGSALVVNLPFATKCTNRAPYTLSLDTSSGVVAGLAYSLALSATSATGTGAAQNYNIVGTMAANQPGDCTGSCTGSKSHTLTVSY